MNAKKKFLKTLIDIRKALEANNLNSDKIITALSLVEENIQLLPEGGHTKSLEGVAGNKALNNFPLPSEIENTDHHFALFADGACRGNPGPGAWGVLAQDGKGDVIFESSGIEFNTTNNKMELMGAIQALLELDNYLLEKNIVATDPELKVFVYSDSRYVVDGISDWVNGWKKRGWKKADNKAPENLELWKKLDEVRYLFPFVKFLWVKGHDGHPQNEHCDKLANETLDTNL